jgi:5-methylcytosine-specific restriction endonuclease McrA
MEARKLGGWNKKNHIFLDGVEFKACSRCGKLLPLSDYHKDSSKCDGLHGFCKKCTSNVNATTYKRNPERVKSNTERRYRKNPKSKAYNPKYYQSPSARAKKRARDIKRRMLVKGTSQESKITADVIKNIIDKYQGKCAYCGKECVDVYHIDHKLPLSRGGGNNFDNLALSCPHCNLSKNAKTDIEFCGIAV